MKKKELLAKKIAMISLGCDKNTVDAERMMYLLETYGFQFVTDIEEAQIAIVNTCAFIMPSKMESINKILETAKYKENKLEKLIVTGCLPQRDYEVLLKEIPEIDACVRLKNNEHIVEIICDLYGLEMTEELKMEMPCRVVSTPKHYAFLKISDGCNNFCSYCTIPFIRGRFKSTPIECLIDEAKALVKNGVKELMLVAQDVTNYGSDLYGEPKLVELIQELSKISGLKWIRLHYCYPHLITDKLLDEIEKNNKVCKYLDIPLQHISNHILKNMNRKDTKESIEALLDKIKALKKPISIRSTFIVGFPGETLFEVNELVEFLKKYKLDNVGFFTYSREKNTKAYKMKYQIPEIIKKIRLKRLQRVQQHILIENQKQRIGKTLKCICEDVMIGSVKTYVLRSEYNSTDVDTLVYVKSEKDLEIGEMYDVKITGVLGIDLLGTLEGK